MNEINLEHLCKDVISLCEETGRFLRAECATFSSSRVEEKGTNDFVSDVDKEAERRIVSRLATLIPDAGFITEENTLTIRDKQFEWIVDPLDGTTNFIHHVPCYAISIALRKDEEIVLGVIFEVNLQEAFYTWTGAPSYLNGMEIRVSDKAALRDCLIATGFPNRNYDRMKPYIAMLTEMMFETHGIRRMGSAAVDMAYVACGRFDGFYEYHLSPWDVAAGAIIVKNAGGLVSDFSGKDNYLFGKEMAAGNPQVHKHILEMVVRYFGH